MKTWKKEEFRALIGIDWADQKHDICERCVITGKSRQTVIKHSVDSIEQWARELRKRFDGPVAVALELAKGPLVHALRRYDHIVLFPIQPNAVAKYRQAWAPSGAKDDPTDAALIQEMLDKHFDKMKPLNPQSEAMRTLQQLVEDRRKLIDDKVRLTNRITSALKEHFPQVLEWFADKATLLFCDFVDRYPSAGQARRARRDTLKRLFAEHNIRNKAKVDERIDAIKACRPLTEDPAVVVPSQMLVTARITQLRTVLQSMKAYDQAIEKLYQAHADFHIFDSLPAAGPVFGPRLLAAFGEDRARFDNASAVQRYSGTAPVTKRSGKMHIVQWRYRCNTFLRQSFVEWAALTIPRSHWAAVYYAKQREAGKDHNKAVRALAFRWIRILYRCWQDGVKYSENTRLKTLRKAGSPLVAATEKYAS